MTTPNASERFIVDSSGWVEYLGDGPKAASFATYIENTDSLLVPTIVVYEVSKKLLREYGKTLADRFYSLCDGFGEKLVLLDLPAAWLAAGVSLDKQLPMADAIIYGAALTHRAGLITSDTHFSGLPGVTII